MQARFALVLHSHIPYCRRSGTWPAGEEWLFEAMLETYLPLLLVQRGWQRDDIPSCISVGIVPVLAEQLADSYLQQRFGEYLDDKVQRADRDQQRFASDPKQQQVAHHWHARFCRLRSAWHEELGRDLLGAWRQLQEAGCCEIMTSAATHGFLPLLERDSAIRAQVAVGVETYRRFFGRDPRSFWLPECAYRPAVWSQAEQRERTSIDGWLRAAGLGQFVVEGVGITSAQPLDGQDDDAAHSLYRGHRLASGMVVFGRNEATGKQVWSPAGGYPGDPHYLEFHQKDPESGLRYWRVTGSDDKALYDPVAATERVDSHAHHFVGLVRQECERAAQQGVAAPVVVAPYDCELFGHWWHEGVDWLDRVLRLLASDDTVRSASLSETAAQPECVGPTIAMSASTWGLNSDDTVWRNQQHGWVWPLINDSSRQIERVLAQAQSRGQPHDQRGQRLLRQLCRELLLMQGSDWPFLLFTGQATEYANQRFHHHHQRLLKLLWAADNLDDTARLSDHDLQEFEEIDNAWPDLDWKLFLADGQ